MAIPIPIICRPVGASFNATAEITATTAGCRFTSVTEAAMVVR